MELKTYAPESKRAQRGIDAEHKSASVFQPDILLSAQYFENLRRNALLQPEKRLMLSVLEDAINCFQDNAAARNGKRKRLFEEAEDWILQEDADWLFSYESICEHLRISPTYLRLGLLRLRERKLRNSGFIDSERRKLAS